MGNSKEYLQKLFGEEASLQEMARDRSFARELCPYNPGGMGGSIMGSYPRMMSPAMKAAIWGGPENLTLSLLKTDVIDRRYVDKDHFTLQDLEEAAFSEKNKDFDDMPMAGMTRPPFAVLHKNGGRYDHALWSEIYPFPCQKPVGQIIVKAEDMKGASQPAARQHMRDGTVKVDSRKDEKRLSVHIAMSMARNVLVLDTDWENLQSPLEFRLYRNLDQGHRRYTDENGNYLPFVVYRPADPDKPLEYYNFEADKDINGRFEPPTTGTQGRFFWVHQVFPREGTFPEGFRYVMMAMVGKAEADIHEHPLAKGLGSMPHIPRDNQGMLVVPGIRTMTHPEMFERMAVNYSYVASAPGVTAGAALKKAGTGRARLYVAVVTVNETPDYMEKAKELLLEAERLGYEGIARENKDWFDALYQKRESGRILLGKSPQDKKAAADLLFEEVYQSWTSGHMGYCNPDPAKYEGSASYACYDVDTQSWHSLPCYNELFTEGKYFMRNQYEPKLLWPRLITCWHETLKEKARLKFGLPGMCMAHGYLPAAKQSPWYMENNCLDFTMEVPGQIMKVIWNFWDYTGDEAFLRDTAYPILRDLAVFYEAFARRGWDGKQFNLAPTVETESYGVSYQLRYTRNNTGALALFRWVLKKAAETAEYLSRDKELIPGFLEVAEHLAPYPKFRVESGEIMGANEVAFPRFTRGDHFMFPGYYPVNLADEINLDSPRELKELMIRTADVLGAARNWEPYILLGASKERIPCKYAYGAVKITDYATLTRDIIEAPERLMNSRSGRIHLFPAVPDWTAAAFRDFLARGGFRVSAARDEGGVRAVTIKAARSIPCRIMNPWPGEDVLVTDIAAGAAVPHRLDRENGECIVFDAEKGKSYSIDKA